MVFRQDQSCSYTNFSGGDCLRHPELPANKVIVPTHGRRGPGRPTKTMLKTLIKDAGVVNKEELISCMQDVLCGESDIEPDSNIRQRDNLDQPWRKTI